MTGPDRVTSEQVIESATTFNVLPRQLVGELKRGDETPSVLNVENWRTINSEPITITDFRDGQDGQIINIIGDGFTTVDHNTEITRSGDAAALLELGRRYTFQYFYDSNTKTGVWIEQSGSGAGGSVWRSGSGVPSAGLGINGDYYLDTDNGNVYRKAAGSYTLVTNIKGPAGTAGAAGAPGTNGTNGIDGAPGSVWRAGSGAPSGGLGINGDFYLDNVTGDVYLKAAGAYTIVANIKGPAGVGGGGGSLKTTTLAFGTRAVKEKVIAVADIAVTGTNKIVAWQSYENDEAEMDQFVCVAGLPVAGVGFTLFAKVLSDDSMLQGTRQIHYILG